GALEILQTVEAITGQHVQYYIIVDYKSFVDIIDAIGGINVTNDRAISDPLYPGPGYSYEHFELSTGLHHLNGTTALKYVRERHTDPDGDFGRARRQQQVIQAVRNRIFSLRTFLNPLTINNLLDALGNNVLTNIRPEEISSFIALSKELDTQNIATTVVDAWRSESLLRVSHVFYGSVRAFILVPRVGNFSEIHDLAENIFDKEKNERRQKQITEEKARIVVVNQSGNTALPQRVQSVLRDDLGFPSVTLSAASKGMPQKQSAVVDYTDRNKPFSLDELLKKLPAKTIPAQSGILETNMHADFVVLLGEDIIERYTYAQNSYEDLINAKPEQQFIDLLGNSNP
ncbi:MAG TPA: LCP family protein, partial [Patescibacteria group bacterium]|nr:LCP family protein [Patescibacteria group bacterium]